MRNVFGKVGFAIQLLALLAGWVGLVAFSASDGGVLPLERSIDASPWDANKASDDQFLSSQLHAGTHLALASSGQQGDSNFNGVDTGVLEEFSASSWLYEKSLDGPDDFQVAYFNGSAWQGHPSLEGTAIEGVGIPCMDAASAPQCLVSESKAEFTSDVGLPHPGPDEQKWFDNANLPSIVSKPVLAEQWGRAGASERPGWASEAGVVGTTSGAALASKTFSMTVSGCEPEGTTYTAVLEGDELEGDEKDMSDPDGDGVYTARWDALPVGVYTSSVEVDGVGNCF